MASPCSAAQRGYFPTTLRLPKLCSWLPGNSPPPLFSPLPLLCLSAALPHHPSSSFPLPPLLLLFTSRHHPASNTLNQSFVPPACPFQIRLHATIVNCVQDNPYDFTPYIKSLIILKQNNSNEKWKEHRVRPVSLCSQPPPLTHPLHCCWHDLEMFEEASHQLEMPGGLVSFWNPSFQSLPMVKSLRRYNSSM